MKRLLATALAAVAAATALTVGTAGAARWTEPVCVRHAGWIGELGQDVIRHYAGMVYPADVSYLLFRNRIEQFQQHGCSRSLLGRALLVQLTARQRARLVSLLPAALARTVRRAVAAASV